MKNECDELADRLRSRYPDVSICVSVSVWRWRPELCPPTNERSYGVFFTNGNGYANGGGKTLDEAEVAAVAEGVANGVLPAFIEEPKPFLAGEPS